MSEKDFMVGVTGAPSVGQISRKPRYLITLDDFKGKTKIVRYFITVDKPDFRDTFVQVKGVYSEFEEEEILKKFSDILDNTPKEAIMDIMFPPHRIYSIRSLVFNANKPSTLVK
jgi:hypothetical protein